MTLTLTNGLQSGPDPDPDLWDPLRLNRSGISWNIHVVYQVSQSPWCRWLSVKNPALKNNQRARGEEGCKPSKHMCLFVSND